MYNWGSIIPEIALMIFELLLPSFTSPAEDWATLASCALVCRHWYIIASPFLYKNIVLDMSPKWPRLRSLANSTSPFKRNVKNLRLTLKLQNLATQSDAIDFGTPTMNIATFTHNCTWLKQILCQFETVDSVELDLTALSPFDEDDDGDGDDNYDDDSDDDYDDDADDDSLMTTTDTPNALQPHSMKSVMLACYRYLSNALLPLRTGIVTKNQTTPIYLRIRHPVTGIDTASILNVQFMWKGIKKILKCLRPCRVTSMEVEVDNRCRFNWLRWFSQLNYLCFHQSHTSIFEDSTTSVEIANNLARYLPNVNIASLSFCGLWSHAYPGNLTTLTFEFPRWPNVDICLFFSGLVTANSLQTLNLHFRCFDFYDGVSPTDQALAVLTDHINARLQRVSHLTLFVDTDYHYELGHMGDPTPAELLDDKALDRQARLWRTLLGSMKSTRIVEIREFSCSRREILDFVNNMERLELLISEKEMVWAAEKANQMGCEWRLKHRTRE